MPRTEPTPDVGGVPHATMLVFIFTDAVVEQAVLARSLTEASEVTFNACSVDGDTSTNDTVIAMASGASGKSPSEAALTTALTKVCDVLARSMVADGEGANHVAEIRVKGLASRADAKAAAKTIATSLLVKTMLFGEDANWGRLLAAAGRAGVAFDPRRADYHSMAGDVPDRQRLLRILTSFKGRELRAVCFGF